MVHYLVEHHVITHSYIDVQTLVLV